MLLLLSLVVGCRSLVVGLWDVSCGRDVNCGCDVSCGRDVSRPYSILVANYS